MPISVKYVYICKLVQVLIPCVLMLLKHLLTYLLGCLHSVGVVYGGVVTRHWFRYHYYFTSRRQDGAGIAIICVSTEEEHSCKVFWRVASSKLLWIVKDWCRVCK